MRCWLGGRRTAAGPASAAAAAAAAACSLVLLSSASVVSVVAGQGSGEPPMPVPQEPREFLRTADFIKAGVPDNSDRLGSALDYAAGVMAVGAPQEDSCVRGVQSSPNTDNSCSEAGAVYVWKRKDEYVAEGEVAWSFEAFIKSQAPTNTGDQRFGESVSLDGDRLAVGAPDEDTCDTGVGNYSYSSGTCFDAGAVWLYRRDAEGAWRLETRIRPSVAARDAKFGTSVALRGDTLVVGSAEHDGCDQGVDASNFSPTGCDSSGAVHIFTRGAGGWVENTYIKPQNANWQAEFGFKVAVSADAKHVLVGARRDSVCEPRTNMFDTNCYRTGTVYHYYLGTSGYVYHDAYKSHYPRGGGEDEFGYSFALSPSGRELVVGARFESSCLFDDTTNCWRRGSVYVMQLDTVTNSYNVVQRLQASTPRSWMQFGLSVVLSRSNGADSADQEGNYMAIGSPEQNGCLAGVSNGTETDNCGGSGSIWLYVHNGTAWEEVAHSRATNPRSGNEFGEMLALDGADLLVGCPDERSGIRTVLPTYTGNDESRDQSGAVYSLRLVQLEPGPPPPPPPPSDDDAALPWIIVGAVAACLCCAALVAAAVVVGRRRSGGGGGGGGGRGAGGGGGLAHLPGLSHELDESGSLSESVSSSTDSSDLMGAGGGGGEYNTADDDPRFGPTSGGEYNTAADHNPLDTGTPKYAPEYANSANAPGQGGGGGGGGRTPDKYAPEYANLAGPPGGGGTTPGRAPEYQELTGAGGGGAPEYNAT